MTGLVIAYVARTDCFINVPKFLLQVENLLVKVCGQARIY